MEKHTMTNLLRKIANNKEQEIDAIRRTIEILEKEVKD